MSNSTKVKSFKAQELAKDKAFQVNTNTATMVQLELKCTAHCTLCPYETPELDWELAVWLWEMHMAEHHHHHSAAPPASPSCTPLIDSMMLPVTQSIPAKDFYGLHTKSLPVGIKVNRKSSEEAESPPRMQKIPLFSEEAALKTSGEAALKTSEEAAPPDTSPCTPLTDSVKWPVVLSINAEDYYGLFAKSPTVGNKIKGNRDNKSSRQEEVAQNILRGGRKSSKEAALKPETMCSSKKPAGHESLCTSS